MVLSPKATLPVCFSYEINNSCNSFICRTREYYDFFIMNLEDDTERGSYKTGSAVIEICFDAT